MTNCSGMEVDHNKDNGTLTISHQFLIHISLLKVKIGNTKIVLPTIGSGIRLEADEDEGPFDSPYACFGRGLMVY